MKYILFVEGHTEKKALHSFFKRWLDKKINPHQELDVVEFEGGPHLIKESPNRARLYLEQSEVMAVIALLDLYGLNISYPTGLTDAAGRYRWAKAYLEKKVDCPKFFQYFAVHEIEAWLLSDPRIFSNEIRSSFSKKIEHPEKVNFTEPPGKLLDRIYRQKTERGYKKITQGYQLFQKLDPFIAYNKCPYLKQMLDKMLDIARDHGLSVVE